MNSGRWRPVLWVAGGLLFGVLLTANSGGYRYGASDQAFHIPAVLRALDPHAFPRDTALINANARLTVFHPLVGGIVRATGASLETVFFAGYLASVAILWTALILIGGSLFRNPLSTIMLAAIVTLRHRIPKTSVNSFEPYFYPRTLAFAIGLVAIAAVLRRRPWMAVMLSALATAIHPTTALWFMVLIAVATLAQEPSRRRLIWLAAAVAIAAILWAIVKGPLAGMMVRMDDMWLAALESKDDLFPTAWPAWVWAANLALPALLWWVHRVRSSRGDATREHAALVFGGLALAGLFLVAMPLVAMRWALPVALQVSRVFWLIEFLLVVFIVALIGERLRGDASRKALALVAAALMAVAAGRALYVMRIEFPDRRLFETGLRRDPWLDAMLWLKRQPLDVHVWADPGHAWKYGTSVRAAAGRDVFLEESKDSAMAIYSREIAARVIERRSVPSSFDIAPDGTVPLAMQLATRYGIDYLVTESELPLPLAYRNSRFRIYRIGTDR